MSTTLSEQQKPVVRATIEDRPTATDLPRQPETGRFATTPGTALVVTALSLAFLYFAFQPLWHTDLWGHLAYGRLLFATRALPATEPLMPLSEGVAYVNTAWLSQVVGFKTITAFGATGLQVLYAAGVTYCCLLLAWCVHRQTRNSIFTLASISIFLWIGWQHIAIVRPQLAGMACFVSLFALLLRRQWSPANWVLIPLLFALWANLHGSFLVGLVMLAAFCAGRGCDILRRTDKFAAVARDRMFRRYLLLTELAAVAVLLNPYGIELYTAVFSISSNPNLTDLVEWDALTLQMKQGQAAAIVALMLVMLYRVSPRRVRVTEIILLAGLGGAALWTSRMIVWWAPVAAYFLAIHGNAAWKRANRRKSTANGAAHGPRLLWTAASCCVIVAAIAGRLNESALQSLGVRIPSNQLSAGTPTAAVAHLHEFPPVGQVFNSYEWGDYLLWAGPPNMQVFVASHAHLVPREVWRSYMQVTNLSAGWDDTLARFDANTVIVEKQRRRSLVNRLTEDDEWQKTFEDELAVVFRRVNPLGVK